MAPVLFLSHGGGPLPLIGDRSHLPMINAFDDIEQFVEKPEAILLISAHWEEQDFTLTGHTAPPLIYDYYNFPPESYEITYPAPGNPELALQIQALLQGQSLTSKIDAERGFDHGMFVPLKLLWPDADIPVLQLSLKNNMNATEHLTLGEAINCLRKQNVTIIGSGYTFHNLQAMFRGSDPQMVAAGNGFADWLGDIICNPDIDKKSRKTALLNWDEAPNARFNHPREEHLLPIHVCAGAAGYQPATQQWRMELMGYPAQCFYWA